MRQLSTPKKETHSTKKIFSMNTLFLVVCLFHKCCHCQQETGIADCAEPPSPMYSRHPIHLFLLNSQNGCLVNRQAISKPFKKKKKAEGWDVVFRLFNFFPSKLKSPFSQHRFCFLLFAYVTMYICLYHGACPIIYSEDHTDQQLAALAWLMPSPLPNALYFSISIEFLRSIVQNRGCYAPSSPLGFVHVATCNVQPCCIEGVRKEGVEPQERAFIWFALDWSAQLQVPSPPSR